MSDINALIAEFEAKGGRVVQCEPGKRALGYSNSEWRKLTQMTTAERQARLAESEEDQATIEHRAERRHELATQFAHVGDREAAVAAAAGEFDL